MRSVCFFDRIRTRAFFRNLLGGKRPTRGRAKARPPIGVWTQFSASMPSPQPWAQAASAPDALATWVAIASIKAGDRQS